MKKFLGAFKAIAASFANQSALAIESKFASQNLTDPTHISQISQSTQPKAEINQSNEADALFIL